MWIWLTDRQVSLSRNLVLAVLFMEKAINRKAEKKTRRLELTFDSKTDGSLRDQLLKQCNSVQ